MKQLIGLLLLLLAVQPMFAKDDYPLRIKVLSTQDVENENGGGNGGGGWSDKTAERVMAEGSDGNTYELVPESTKDVLLPGTFQAKIEKRSMRVCEPKDNGKCRDVKFRIVVAQQTPEPEKATCINEVVCTLLQINLSTRAAAGSK
jgi:hypothetical protein